MSQLAMADGAVMGAFNAQNGGQRNSLVVRFYEEAVIDEKASWGWTEEKFHPETGVPYKVKHEGAGCDKYRPAIFVEIRAPGDICEMRRREIRPSDKLRFREEWAQFEKGIAEPTIGTPIDLLPFIKKAQAMELKAIGISTAENLRDCSDVNGQKVMGFAQLRDRAKDFLLAAEGNAPQENLRRELEARDATIAALTAQMQEIANAQAKKRA